MKLSIDAWATLTAFVILSYNIRQCKLGIRVWSTHRISDVHLPIGRLAVFVPRYVNHKENGSLIWRARHWNVAWSWLHNPVGRPRRILCWILEVGDAGLQIIVPIIFRIWMWTPMFPILICSADCITRRRRRNGRATIQHMSATWWCWVRIQNGSTNLEEDVALKLANADWYEAMSAAHMIGSIPSYWIPVSIGMHGAAGWQSVRSDRYHETAWTYDCF